MKEKLREYFEKVKEWESSASLRDKIIVLLIPNIAMILLFYQFYFVSKQKELKKLKKEINVVVTQIEGYRKYVTQYQKLKLQVKERLKFLNLVKTIFPQHKDIPGLLKSISESAKKNSLEIINFSPKKILRRNYYDAVPFKISLRGPFMNFLSFLNELTEFSRIVVVHDMDIRLINNNQVGMVIDLYTFQYTGRPQIKRKKRRKRRK